ncbi:hypothetical protein ASG84_26750 [Rhodococcus sp. Leaf278]|uniref:hypothetical protein n=1 Tax=Rhodococcus sp. Leaf278 TaxID=1736319 RepID=UPI0007130D0B|nr:hypothetical protein [Rhodococcus sp. Leaf278]KQU47269.1 hypothetical protein ASG84_26750 [Rhodococcus sp. Leaf278]
MAFQLPHRPELLREKDAGAPVEWTLPQAVLNAQAGWFLDMRTREWVLREDLSEEQKAMT